MSGLWIGMIGGLILAGLVAALVTAMSALVSYQAERRRTARIHRLWTAGMLDARTRRIA